MFTQTFSLFLLFQTLREKMAVTVLPKHPQLWISGDSRKVAYIPLNKDSFNGILMKKEISPLFYFACGSGSKWEDTFRAGFGGPNHEYENESNVWNKSSFDLCCKCRIFIIFADIMICDLVES